ncbi:hypothetical protein PV10_06773 [Exophiala mesophila]|uniref:Uncharacterized protein n=1 Tax=Exophiala mesophila TaxID=212818 RepID=A0A0D1XVN5_EXOME|nr:uncharacterized protein PV10_06773 [Exophiala mesophila]KIV92321.1 hypothetical protein PV10_06773 [Exophiala mesophila]
MATAQPPQMILFTYDISVFGRKMDWYFALTGLKYFHCITLNRLPRPMLEKLGIKYRRIPILAIGRDIYCDTRLIISKLEELFPQTRIGGKTPFERGVDHLIENWVIDGGPFWRTSGLIPWDADVIKDPEWCEDRREMTGRPFDANTLKAARPESLSHSRMYFNQMEKEHLADGREFLLGGPEPTLADIHALWVFHWTVGMSMGMGATLEKDIISDKQFPKTFAFIDRAVKAITARQIQNQNKPHELSADEAVKTILDSDFFESEGDIDPLDPLKLEKGQMVEIYPVESGFNHRDRGELVSIGINEVVIASTPNVGQGVLRIHYPRVNIRIQPASDTKL